MPYELSDRFSTEGNGTNILPVAYAKHVLDTLPAYANFWVPFVAKGQEFQVFNSGQGLNWKIAILEDVDPSATALSSGTAMTTTDSSNLSTVTGTIEEYAQGEYIENFQNWASNFDTISLAAAKWYRTAAMSRNKIIGDKLASVGDAVSFACDDSGETVQGSAYTGSVTYIKPANVRAIRSWLMRTGQNPFDNGKFAMVGPPGAFDALKAQSEFYSSAAELGLPDFFMSGEVKTYGGFMFFEEPGKNRSTTYNTVGTVGTHAGVSLVLTKNCVVGGDTLNDPGLIKMYGDIEEDMGRRGKIGYLFKAGYGFTVSTGTASRVFKLFSQHSG